MCWCPRLSASSTGVFSILRVAGRSTSRRLSLQQQQERDHHPGACRELTLIDPKPHSQQDLTCSEQTRRLRTPAAGGPLPPGP